MLSEERINEMDKWLQEVPFWRVIVFARAIEGKARQQALEEAAQVCDSVDNYANPMTARDCSDAIRALKDQP